MAVTVANTTPIINLMITDNETIQAHGDEQELKKIIAKYVAMIVANA